MCINCWNEHESPAIVNDNTLKAAELIAKVYYEHCVGGNLHIQLDDWNIEHFGSTFDEWLEGISSECDSPEDYQLQKECYDFLKELTIDERASALAMYDGYFETDRYKLPEYEPLATPIDFKFDLGKDGNLIYTVTFVGTDVEMAAVVYRAREMGLLENEQ